MTELDKIVLDDNIGVKRSNKEILILFKKVINHKSWIVEDIGRKILKEVKKKQISYVILNLRIIKRLLKQRLKIEESSL